MYQTRNLKERMTLFVSIFLPILIYQLANFSASFVDTTMTGQYHTLHLAGVSMATSLWSPFLYFSDWHCLSLGSDYWTPSGTKTRRKNRF